MNVTNVVEFEAGRTNIHHEEWGGWLSTATTGEMVEKLMKVLLKSGYHLFIHPEERLSGFDNDKEELQRWLREQAAKFYDTCISKLMEVLKIGMRIMWKNIEYLCDA